MPRVNLDEFRDNPDKLNDVAREIQRQQENDFNRTSHEEKSNWGWDQGNLRDQQRVDEERNPSRGGGENQG